MSASQTGREGGARGGWAKLPTFPDSHWPLHGSCACSLPICGRPGGFSLLGWLCTPIAGYNTARPQRGKSVDPHGRPRHGLGRSAPGLWLTGLGGPTEGRSGQGGQMQKEPSARRPRFRERRRPRCGAPPMTSQQGKSAPDIFAAGRTGRNDRAVGTARPASQCPGSGAWSQAVPGTTFPRVMVASGSLF